MAFELPISSILQIAKVCQYLSAINVANNHTFKGADIDERLIRLIYMERTGIQRAFDLNPNDPTLRNTANYLFSILKGTAQAQKIINNQTGILPIITGPANQSVLVGQTATFSVSMVSSTPYTLQWYLNGVIIPGATGLTYNVTNAQLSQSGGLYSVVATNSTGSVSSVQGLLTVTSVITGFLYYTSTDPGPTLQSNSDPFAYQSNYSITHNIPIPVPLSVAAASNQFLVIKVPSTESMKTTWFNTVFNLGGIPDFVFATALTFGGFTYYYTKQLVSLDPSQPLILS